MVGERGFEPPTPWSRTRCSTRLSHSPTNVIGYSTTHITGSRSRELAQVRSTGANPKFCRQLVHAVRVLGGDTELAGRSNCSSPDDRGLPFAWKSRRVQIAFDRRLGTFFFLARF